jgi:hypothetical protein
MLQLCTPRTSPLSLGKPKISRRTAVDSEVRSKRLPVLPGLEARAVEEEVEGLPVVEHLVAVVDQVGGRAHVAEEPERQEREEPLDAFVLAAGGPPAALGVLGVPVVGLRRRRGGAALARR